MNAVKSQSLIFQLQNARTSIAVPAEHAKMNDNVPQ